MEVHKQQRMKQKIIRLERTSESLLVQSGAPDWSIEGRLLRLLSSVLKIPHYGNSKASLENLFHCFTTFAVKFLFPLVLSLSTLDKTNLTMPSHPFSSILVDGNNEISPKLSFLQHDQTNFFQLFLVHHMLQSCYHLGPPQDLFQLHHCFSQCAPEATSKTNTAGSTLATAAQYAGHLQHCMSTQPQPVCSPSPCPSASHIFFGKAAFQTRISQFTLLLRVIPSKMQNF